jgi:hypothetical protein
MVSAGVSKGLAEVSNFRSHRAALLSSLRASVEKDGNEPPGLPISDRLAFVAPPLGAPGSSGLDQSQTSAADLL